MNAHIFDAIQISNVKYLTTAKWVTYRLYRNLAKLSRNILAPGVSSLLYNRYPSIEILMCHHLSAINILLIRSSYHLLYYKP